MEIKDLKNYSFGKEAEKIEKKKEAITKPTFMQKNFASMIDVSIVFIIRFLVASILGVLFYNLKLKEPLSQINFHNITQEELLTIFGGFNIIYNLIIFTIAIILTGGLYYIIMFASKWGGTLGCKIADLKLIDKKSGNNASILQSVVRYFLCLMPLFFMMVLAYKIYVRELDITVFILVLLSAFWYDLSIILKVQRGIPDLIAGTTIISTRLPKKS